MRVNQEWCACILSAPSLWHEITITDNQYALVPLLVRIGKHIRKYTIYEGSPGIVDGSLNMMFFGCMNNIQSLIWENCLCDDMDILYALQYLKDSLTELTLFADYDHVYSPPHFLSILRTCPNLKRLNVVMPHAHVPILFDDPLVLPNGNLNLTHLKWITGSSLQQEDIEPLFAVCPRLRYLQVGCFEGDLDVFFKPITPPSLKYLSIDDVAEGYESDLEYWDDEEEYHNANDDDENKNTSAISTHHQQYHRREETRKQRQLGLHALTLTCTDAHSWEIIKMVISREQYTLEKLTLYHDYNGFDGGYLIQNFRGKWLNIYGCGCWSESAELDATLIGHQNDNDSSNTDFDNSSLISSPISSTAVYPRLWHIHSTGKITDSESDVAALIIALKNRTLATSHKVTRLRLAKSPAGGGETILPLLLEFPSLQVLKLEQCTFYTQTLIQFVKQLATRQRGISALNHLGFTSVTGLTDAVIMALAHVSGLRRIKLWRCDSLTDQAIRYLVDGKVGDDDKEPLLASDLEDLELLQCKHITWDAISYAQGKLDARQRFSTRIGTLAR
ncbi:hypothetical protein BDB00DRAFT_811005 [Zychaea mexicana]|uniref:uncharacterized protein n=1 Tax=Zychaea mexicana TaxID=64656 RepID=UPI0022FDC10A|nr:uncharacterized protein BDB00DRAFT_811005 [Zychaea mexicana]KAI9495934.1 hypothetical protein BDB00DRAFT_811005 [Zychaea mexicana]